MICELIWVLALANWRAESNLTYQLVGSGGGCAEAE